MFLAQNASPARGLPGTPIHGYVSRHIMASTQWLKCYGRACSQTIRISSSSPSAGRSAIPPPPPKPPPQAWRQSRPRRQDRTSPPSSSFACSAISLSCTNGYAHDLLLFVSVERMTHEAKRTRTTSGRLLLWVPAHRALCLRGQPLFNACAVKYVATRQCGGLWSCAFSPARDAFEAYHALHVGRRPSFFIQHGRMP